MYLGAALCMWALRSWTIGQVEQVAAEQKKKPEDIGVAAAEALDSMPTSRQSSSNALKRLVIWKKV